MTTAPTLIEIDNNGNPDPCADCHEPLGVEYLTRAGERSHTRDGSCTLPGWKPAPSSCFVCAGPLETDGVAVWCQYDCTGDSDTNADEEDDEPDHRYNSAPHCGKCGGPCEMDPNG